ncbi:MAG: hypothetical protein WCL70_07925 [Paludibacter sp.]
MTHSTRCNIPHLPFRFMTDSKSASDRKRTNKISNTKNYIHTSSVPGRG